MSFECKEFEGILYANFARHSVSSTHFVPLGFWWRFSPFVFSDVMGSALLFMYLEFSERPHS